MTAISLEASFIGPVRLEPAPQGVRLRYRRPSVAAAAAAFADPDAIRKLSAACGYRREALAAALQVSQRQLERMFVKHLGATPARWLHDERLHAARRLLLSAASVKEVAFELSFSQPSQFCRDFRRRFGCTPAEWMKSARPSSAAG